MPICVALVVIAEILFLGRLDIANKASRLNSWADSFYQFTSLPWAGDEPLGSGRVVEEMGVVEEEKEEGGCEEWLEREDAVVYSRDFSKHPILISGNNEVCFLF